MDKEIRLVYSEMVWLCSVEDWMVGYMQDRMLLQCRLMLIGLKE